MGDLRDLIAPDVRRSRSVTGLWRGVFIDAPMIESDLLRVILPDVDTDLFFGPCKWSPRTEKQSINVAEPGEANRFLNLAVPRWPAVGDLCLVTKSNLGYYWIVEWWPYGGDEESNVA